MKFDYKREEITIDIEGTTYPIPTKTATLLDGINTVSTGIANAKTAIEQVTEIKKGVALFLGEDAVDKIFPEEIKDIDTDKISALWQALNNLSNAATEQVIKKYAPNPIIKTK